MVRPCSLFRRSAELNAYRGLTRGRRAGKYSDSPPALLHAGSGAFPRSLSVASRRKYQRLTATALCRIHTNFHRLFSSTRSIGLHLQYVKCETAINDINDIYIWVFGRRMRGDVRLSGTLTQRIRKTYHKKNHRGSRVKVPRKCVTVKAGIPFFILLCGHRRIWSISAHLSFLSIEKKSVTHLSMSDEFFEKCERDSIAVRLHHRYLCRRGC